MANEGGYLFQQLAVLAEMSPMPNVMCGSNKDLQKFKLVSWESHGGGCGHRFHKEKIQLNTGSQKATAKFTRRTMLALVRW